MDICEVPGGSADIRYRYGRSRLVGNRRSRGTSGAGSVTHSREQPGPWIIEEPDVPIQTAASLASWGHVYQVNTQTVGVGAPLNFSNNGPLNGINHTPGTSGIEVTLAGTYNIFFSIFTAQNNPQDWAVVVNGVVRSRLNSAGQTISGATSLTLDAGDNVTIRNVATAPDPATLRTGDFTTAYVLIYKVDN